MSTPSLATLLVQYTKDQLFSYGLQVASAVGIDTSTWRTGDPTRSLYLLEAEILAALETVITGFISSGFLDYATGAWLIIVAKQVFNVDVPDATYATTTITLTNALGGVYDIDPGDLMFKSSANGKTYHNTSGGHLASGPATTLTLDIVADEAGSASSAGAGQIDTMVTTLLGVTCSNVDAAVGLDVQSEDTTRQQCRDKLGSLSPNGPKDAYSYVSRNSDLTEIKTITRVRVYPESDTGDVLVYLASPSGAVAGGDVTAVQNAIVQWALPLTITPTVLSAAAVTVAVTYTVYVYKSVNKTSSQVQADIQTALQDMFASRSIGGDIVPPATTGALYKSLVESAIRSVYPQIFRVDLAAPAADVALGNGDVPALGTITPTVTFVNDP